MHSRAWGKIDLAMQENHHLAHHSADVAAALTALLQLPSFRQRAEYAAGARIRDAEVACLAALAFLHDIEKLAPAFQAKGRSAGHGVTPRDHLRCGWRWLHKGAAEDSLAGCALHLIAWPDIDQWFPLLFAHHGKPVEPVGEI